MKKSEPTIYILGAGAIGKALAVFLKQAGRPVILLRGSVDHQPSRTERLRVELADQTGLEADVEISTLSHYPTLTGTLILTNKSFGNERLARVLHGKTGRSPLVILQNGLGVERAFLEADFPNIYRCVLFATSQSLAESTVRFKPVADSPIGVVKGDPAELASVVEQLNSPLFRFQAEPDTQPVVWKKALVNSAFNSICPLLETDNGIFYREEAAQRLARRIIQEGLAIAHALGVQLTENEVMESLLTISRASDGQLISTLQDIQHRRETEIDALNLEIVRQAQGLDRAESVREIRLLGELIQLKSKLHR